MSELIASSTRDFLFITLNQYNDETTLKRAEVVMRRDQPFFEGGNAFVAAESFRISAAPSDGGGIYYTQVPYTYYMASERDETDVPTLANDPVVNWVRCCHFNRDQLVGMLFNVVREADPAADPPLKALVDVELRMGIRTDPNLWVAPDPNPDNDTGPYSYRTSAAMRSSLHSYFNSIEISQNSFLKLEQSTGSQENGDLKNYFIVGKPLVNPAHTVYGPGCGVQGMFIPRLYLNWDDAYLPALTTAPYQAELKLYIGAQFTNAALQFMTREEFDTTMRSFMSRGVFLEPQSLDQNAANFYYGAMFNVLGPNSTMYTTNPDYIHADGPDKGRIKLPIVAAQGAGGWYLAQHAQAWTETSTDGRPEEISRAFVTGSPGHVFGWEGDKYNITVRVQTNAAVLAKPENIALLTQDNLEDAVFAAMLNPDTLYFQVRSHVRLEVEYFQNPDAAQTIPVTNINDIGWGQVSVHKPREELVDLGGQPLQMHQPTVHSVKRRPNQNKIPLSVYSPNEFFTALIALRRTVRNCPGN